MQLTSGVSTSPWMTSGLIETFPLRADASADVCIIGAGITGLLTAVNLMAEGRSIVILNDGPVCCGETCRSTAHLVTALDDRYEALERAHGTAGATIAAQSHAAGIDHIERIVARLGIECDFQRVDGYLIVPEQHAGRKAELLSRELEAARRAGVYGIQPAESLPPGWPESWGEALRFPRQAQLDPVLFTRALAEHLLAGGVQIFTGTRAVKVRGGASGVVETRGGPVVRCRDIVVATNSPVNDLVAVHTKQPAYQTYVIAVRVPARTLFPALMWDGYWEDDESYHYVRLAPAWPYSAAVSDRWDLLIVGGEDHKTGQDHHDHQRYERLEAWTRKRFPAAGEVAFRWSGEVMEPVDGLAYIGRNPLDNRNVFIATGDSGNGITHGAIASMLLTDLILKRENPWADLYSPARKVGATFIGEYARENLNTAWQYGDWLRCGEVSSVDQIPSGSGAILSNGLHKTAVYKDGCGNCTCLNACCTHLGGVVRWNDQEKTWDCPCHGSRFSAEGRVVHGPAITDLKPAAAPQPEPEPAPKPA